MSTGRLCTRGATGRRRTGRTSRPDLQYPAAMSRGGFFAVDSLSSVHVLVVDDDASFREVLVSLLRYCGALVTARATPDEALVAMNQVKPDVLVVTIGPDGASSLPRRVRARKPEDGGNAPIVVVLRE